MSARRNWDITPGRKSAPAGASSRKSASKAGKRVDTSVPLRARRKRARNRSLVIVFVALALLVGSALYALNHPSLRIRTVETDGAHKLEMEAIAKTVMWGTFIGVIPQDSILFFSQHEIRSAILAKLPDVSALSIQRTGLSSIRISAVERAEAFSWCGVSAALPAAGCYEADGEGFIYRLRESATTSLRIYAPLAHGDTEPVGATVEAARQVPFALQLVRAIESLGAGVESVELRGDEADLYIYASRSRITYILGQEAEAAALAASVMPTISMTDGSIDYLDLRFEGKAYVSRRQSPVDNAAE